MDVFYRCFSDFCDAIHVLEREYDKCFYLNEGLFFIRISETQETGRMISKKRHPPKNSQDLRKGNTNNNLLYEHIKKQKKTNKNHNRSKLRS